jgi:outer membrane murein-binding lipoprotein Lpp
MLKKRLFILAGLCILLISAMMNRDYLIREHLTTKFNVKKELKATNAKVDALEKKVDDMISQASAQTQEAAAAKAQLAAIT